MKYNLGKGKKGLNGYINLDKDDFDLNKIPLPLKTNSGGEIILDNVLEHLKNRYDLTVDINRILKKNGFALITLPVFNPNLSHESYIHTDNYFDVVSKTDDNSIQNKQLFNIKIKYNWNDLKGIKYALWKLFQLIFIGSITFKLTKK